jgi:hypothetical protein
MPTQSCSLADDSCCLRKWDVCVADVTQPVVVCSRLAPVTAMIMIAARKRVVERSNPNRVWPGRAHPSSPNPYPTASDPIPIAVHPNISWTGCDAYWSHHNGSGRWDAHGDADIDMRRRCGKRRSNQQNRDGQGLLELHDALHSRDIAREFPEHLDALEAHHRAAITCNVEGYPQRRGKSSLRWG